MCMPLTSIEKQNSTRKYFNKAKSYAKLCKKFAERAEFNAVKKQATLEE